MEQCVYCQAALAPGERVCQNCGRMQPMAELEQPTMAGSSMGTLSAAPCPRCGVLAAAGAVVCQNCGLSLAPAGNQATRTGGGTFPPPPAPWTGARPNQPAAPTYTNPATNSGPGWSQGAPPGSGPAWQQGNQPGSGPAWPQGGMTGAPPPPPPPAWPQGSGPYQPGMTDPLGSRPTFTGPPTAWQQGPPPYQPTPLPGGFTAPPGMSGPTTQKRSRRPGVIIGIVLAVLVVLGAGGAAAYIFTRPKPTLAVTGPTQSGSNPAGAPDTSFHVVGTDFSSSSVITFFRDGQSLQGQSTVQSDGSGNFTAELPITDEWLLGQHTLSAKDAKDYGPQAPVTVVVLAAPVLTVTSQYKQGTTPAGTPGTTLTIAGKRFALSSPVTLLLDGAPLAGQSPITSDDHGRVQGQVTIGADWTQGTHTLTAKDSQGNVTKNGLTVAIVAQGEAGTPGPNGAPADNATFSVQTNVTGKDSGGNAISFQQSLDVTGQADPAGGTVCSAQDTGQPQTFTGTASGIGYTETIVLSCKGSYKSGHLTYTETAVSDQIVLADGSVCTAQGAYTFGQFDGSFTDSTTINGTYRSGALNAPCRSTRFSAFTRNGVRGTWTGSR